MASSVLFFFKQKTAYEIRKGDWSSDVCSSDLPAAMSLETLKMGLEEFAFDNLKKHHPNIRKNGLRACLREIEADEMLMSGDSLGFIPDATEVVGDTLFIYEIEDTNKLTEAKLDAIRKFGHELID